MTKRRVLTKKRVKGSRTTYAKKFVKEANKKIKKR